MNHRDDYRKMVVALLDAKTVVLSLLRQLNLEVKIPKEQSSAITAKPAINGRIKSGH